MADCSDNLKRFNRSDNCLSASADYRSIYNTTLGIRLFCNKKELFNSPFSGWSDLGDFSHGTKVAVTVYLDDP